MRLCSEHQSPRRYRHSNSGKMLVTALFAVCLALAAAQESNTTVSLEERMFEDVERIWELFPKNVFEGYVTYFDLLEFFTRYDTDSNGQTLSVDEDEFAVGLAADLNIPEVQARAYFKTFDAARYTLLLRDEVIDEENVQLFVDTYAYFDLGLDDEGFLFWFSIENIPYPFGVIFNEFKAQLTTPVNYNDYISFEVEWQELFDFVDTNGDELWTPEEVTEFYVGGGYGLVETSQALFNYTDIDGNGFVDKTIEWGFLFSRLDNNIVDNVLNYDEFVQLYAFIWGVAEPASRAEREAESTFSFEKHMQLCREKVAQN